MSQKATVLFVDDMESIRFAMKEHLSRDFEVLTVGDAYAALSLCAQRKIDLMISDIKMPGLSGIELIRQVRRKYPQMRYALMTAYNVDDFIDMAIEEKINNIIPKSLLLEIEHVLIMARKLLAEDPFGIHYYFPKAPVKKLQLSDVYRMFQYCKQTQRDQEKEDAFCKATYYCYQIENFKECGNIIDKISSILVSHLAPLCVQQIIDELSINAMKHSYEKQLYELCFGIFGKQTVIGVVDYAGKLQDKKILRYLQRQATLDENSGLPLGLEDSHGRGLYISREQCEHLIFNLNPGHKTEIIAMLSQKQMQNSRAISIFQKDTASMPN